MRDRPLILVVDDDAAILLLMKRLLREFGFDAVTASHGMAALDEVRRSRPDLLLLDRNMPGMGGDEVIAALREDPAAAAIPVVILSGEPMSPDEIRVAGAVAALLKPFDVQDLVAIVRRHTTA